MFCNAKEHLLHFKKASFTVQKGTFQKPKDALLKINRKLILQN